MAVFDDKARFLQANAEIVFLFSALYLLLNYLVDALIGRWCDPVGRGHDCRTSPSPYRQAIFVM